VRVRCFFRSWRVVVSVMRQYYHGRSIALLAKTATVVVMQRMQKSWAARVATFHVAVAALTALSLALAIATQAPAGPVPLVRGSLGRRRVDVRPTTATPTHRGGRCATL
jgi:hypothetical protein